MYLLRNFGGGQVWGRVWFVFGFVLFLAVVIVLELGLMAFLCLGNLSCRTQLNQQNSYITKLLNSQKQLLPNFIQLITKQKQNKKYSIAAIIIKNTKEMIKFTCYYQFKNINNKQQKMSQAQQQKVSFTITDNTQKLMQQHKQKMMPLVRYLKKHGLKFKTAGCMGSKIQYFRTDMLAEVLEKKKQQLAKDTKLNGLVELLKDQLVYFKRPQNSQKLRFPQFLVPTKTNTGKFASFKFDTSQSKRIYFIIVLVMILAGVLFPLWPYQLKYALWIVSVVLLVAMISIIILRLVLYTVLASFGISFWLFPNLFGDYGVLDSLKPLYSVSKWQNDVFSIILRVLSFALFIYYCHSVYTEPEFYKQNFESAKDIVKDVHDWGVGKIKGEAGNFSQRALTMDKIINQTADAFQQQSKDHYTSFEVPDINLGDDNKQQQNNQQNTQDDKQADQNIQEDKQQQIQREDEKEQQEKEKEQV